MNYREPRRLKTIELKKNDDELLTLEIFEYDIFELVYENFTTEEYKTKIIYDEEEKEIYRHLVTEEEKREILRNKPYYF